MLEVLTGALEPAARQWFSVGLGVGFAAALFVILVFMTLSQIDHGFLGLIFLLTLLFFLIAFSLLVAASVRGVDIKIAVAAIDVLALMGGKPLGPRFLQYLESE